MAEFSATILNLCRNQVDLSARQICLALECAATAAPNGRQTKSMAVALNISKPAVTRAADRLEECGLLMRGSLPEDRRACVLSLTKAGTAFVKAMQDGGAKARLAK